MRLSFTTEVKSLCSLIFSNVWYKSLDLTIQFLTVIFRLRILPIKALWLKCYFCFSHILFNVISDMYIVSCTWLAFIYIVDFNFFVKLNVGCLFILSPFSCKNAFLLLKETCYLFRNVFVKERHPFLLNLPKDQYILTVAISLNKYIFSLVPEWFPGLE